MNIVTFENVRYFLYELFLFADKVLDNSAFDTQIVRVKTSAILRPSHVMVPSIDISAITYEYNERTVLWFHHEFDDLSSGFNFKFRSESPELEDPAHRIYFDGLEDLRQSLSFYFANNGCEMRAGIYGIPDNIAPINGEIDGFITWDRQGYYRVREDKWTMRN